MGEMFYRGQPVNVIYGMTYTELRYWHGWHKRMQDEDDRVIKRIKDGFKNA